MSLGQKTITMAETLGLSVPNRSRKPRQTGLTMVMDQGWPTDFVAGMLEAFGDYLDISKLWDPHLLSPTESVRRRIQIYRDHDVIVQPGGIWLELARKQGKGAILLGRLKDIGFNAVEVSNTATEWSGETEDLIALAKSQGFLVFGEVGKKFADGDETRLAEDTIDVDVSVAEFQNQLAAGAWKCYWEGHLLRKVVGDDPESIKRHASTGTQQILEVSKEVGAENIIFEASGLRPRKNRQWLQFWLVRVFGPEVNIGNGRIEELANMESIRTGTHPIFGFESAGNYPWLRSVEAGKESDAWWRR
jgi:phosphosulfolactate synthase